ncbi:MAG: hypothetical protein R3E66_14595 [bacterium]
MHAAKTGPSRPCPRHCSTVEITGPVDRKMIINALNSGAKVFMADFETPTHRRGQRPRRTAQPA